MAGRNGHGKGKQRPKYQPTALPWRTEKLDPETGELKSEFVMLDVGVMMSEAYRDLSSTAKNVLNVVIARFYREAAWRGNGKLNLEVSVSIAVQDCEKLGNPLNWRTLRRSLIELDEAGFIDLDLPKRKGKKTHFRRSDRWEGAEAGSCPKMHEMHTSDMHEMHTGPNLRDLMKGKVLREDLRSTPKPTGKVSLQNQRQVWSNIFEGKDPSSPVDLASCIITLAEHPDIEDMPTGQGELFSEMKKPVGATTGNGEGISNHEQSEIPWQ